MNKYKEYEVLDIIKLLTDNDPEEILKKWNTKKADTLIDLEKWNYPYYVYTFPVILEKETIAEITLVSLYGGSLNSEKPDLMLKYLGEEKYNKSYWAFSHDSYLDCYLTVLKEFELPEIVKGFRGKIFAGIDAEGDKFEFRLSYGNCDNEDDITDQERWLYGDYEYRFDGSIRVVTNPVNGWLLGEKINENINKRIESYE